MRNEPLRRAFSSHLFGSLAERQRFGLRADVGDQYVVMPAQWIKGLRKSDEVARNEPGSLMNQLVERVLTVCSRLTPVNWAGIVGHLFAVERDVRAIALNRQLLQIG